MATAGVAANLLKPARGELSSGLRRASPRLSEGNGACTRGLRSLSQKKFSALWKNTPYVRYGMKQRAKRKLQKWAMRIEKN
eukprot:9491385-Pyramimonas_sp.AAC.1